MNYSIKNLHKKYNELYVLKNFQMDITEGKVTGIIGPSGCGKTTLLNIISGALKPDEGGVYGFENKRMSYIFQEPRLLPWKTVWDNIDWVLKDVLTKKEERYAVIEKYLKIAGLIEYKNYYPKQLSGGMMQRTAIARAFAYPSDILLMDEPFKSIDFDRKLKMMENLQKFLEVDHRTVIFVTHDIQEAVILGDIIHIMSDKPASIRKVIVNELEYSKRRIDHPYILSLQEQIYKALTSDEYNGNVF